MKRFAGSLVRKLRSTASDLLKKYRRRALEAELTHCFQRLEPRRVLTVNGAFDVVTGVLTVDISAGGNTTAVLSQQAGDDASFFLDEDGSGTFDPLAEVGGLKSGVRHLVVNGLGGTNVGAFHWLDPSLAGEPMLYNLQSLTINGVQSVILETRATIANASSIAVSDSITIGSIATGNELNFDNNLTLVASGATGQVISTTNAVLRVDGLVEVRANTIDLGDQAGDTIQFGSLHFESDGSVNISEDSDMLIVNSGLNANTGNTVVLSADGNLTLGANSQIDAIGDVNIQAVTGDVVVTSINSNADVIIVAARNIVDGDSGVDDLDIQATTVTLTAINGNIGSSISDIYLVDTEVGNPNPLEVNASDSYTATANNGMIALDVAGTADITANTNTLWIQSNGNIDYATLPVALVAGKDNLALMADIDNDGTGNLILPNALAVVGDLRLRGNDFTAADGTIDLVANRLMFFSGQTESITATASQIDGETAGSLFLTTTTNTSLTDLNGNTFAARANSDLVVVTNTGSLTVNGAVQSNTGDVLLRTNAATGDININAAVTAPAGHVTVQAFDDIRLTSNVTAGGTGTIYLLANNTVVNGGGVDGVVMTAGSRVTTAGGNILIEARNEGDVQLGLVDAGTNEVSIRAQGSILDNNAWSLVFSNANAGQNQISVTNPLGFAVGDIVSIQDNNSPGNVFAIIAISGNVLTLSGNLTSAFETAQAANVTAVNVRSNRLGMVADTNGNNLGSIGRDDAANGVSNRNLNAIDTQVNFLAAQSSQGIYVREVDGVSVSNIAANPTFVQQVNTDGTLSPISNAALNGLVTSLPPVAAAPIKLQNVSGNLVVDAPITAVGAGDVLLQTLTTGTIVVNALVQSGTGDISVKSADDLLLTNNYSTSGPGTFYFSSGRDIAWAPGVDTLNTAGVHVRLVAGRDILLGEINANGTGDVGLSAGRDILDSNDTVVANTRNVFARNLVMVADSDSNGTGIIGGSDLGNADPNANVNAIDTEVTVIAARSATGIYVRELNGLTIDTATVAVRQVNFNSTDPAATLTLEDLTTTGNGVIKLLSANGDIVINPGTAGTPSVSANGTGDVLLQTLTAGTVVVNALVQSGTGDISVKSADDLLLTNNYITSGPGTFYFSSGRDIAWAPGVDTLNTAGVHVRLVAGRDILLGEINANGTGDVGLSAGRDILDSNDTVVANTRNVFARNLVMVADSDSNGTGIIGGSDLGNADPNANVNAIDTEVTVIAARSATGIYVRELNGLTIDTATVAVRQVNFNSTDPTATLTIEDLTTASNGPIKLLSVNGNIVVNPGTAGTSGISANGNGNVLVQTLITGSITISGSIVSGTGDISVRSVDSITQTANIATNGGTVYLAAGNVITMVGAAQVGSGGGNVLFSARTGTIQLGLIDAGSGNVSLNAGTSILDTNGPSLNVISNALRMIATTGRIGDSDAGNGTPDINVNAIDTQVSILAAQSALGIYLREIDGLTIDNTGDITGGRVNFNSTTTLVTDATLEDLRTTDNGPIKLQSVNLDIVVNPGALGDPGISANGAGDVLLQTLTTGTIVVNALVQSGTGDISVKSADDLLLTNNYSTSGPGTFYFSSGRDIAWAPGVDTLNTAGVHVRLVAGRDILLGEINANGTGDVGLSAGRDILDANDIVVANTRNVFARNLVMVADSDSNGTGIIGGSDLGNADPNANVNAIDTEVTVLAARSATGIYVRELNGLTIDAATVAVRQVNFNSTDPTATLTLEDLTTTGNGVIKLLSANGVIVINPGTAGTPSVSANGVGDVLLQTLNAGDIELNGDVRSGTGNINLRSFDDIRVNASVSTSGTGTVYLLAENNVVDGIGSDGVIMAAAGSISTVGGNIFVEASRESDIYLSRIDAGIGNVALRAERSILDNNDGVTNVLNVSADSLSMVADEGFIGSPNQDRNGLDLDLSSIDTSVNLLAARAAQGIFVREVNGVTIGEVSGITVQRVDFNSENDFGVTASNVDGLNTISGPIKVLVDSDKLEINRPIDASSVGTYYDVTLKAFDGFINQNVGTDSQLQIAAASGSNSITLTNAINFSVGQRIAILGGDSPREVFTITAKAGDVLTLDGNLQGNFSQADANVVALTTQVKADRLTLYASQYAHFHDTSITSLAAQVFVNQNLDSWEVVNPAANNRGDDFVDKLTTLSEAERESLRAEYRFQTRHEGSGYSLYLINDRSLDVASIAAGSLATPSASPNIYVETTGTSNLTINGTVQTWSNSETEGGIVLIAAKELEIITATGSLVTATSQGVTFNQIINNEELNPKFFNADPVPSGVNGRFTTKTVTFTPGGNPVTATRHIFQQVAIQFGNAGERGFLAIIGFADGKSQLFDVAGEQGEQPFVSDNKPINAIPKAPGFETGLFVRQEAFDQNFLFNHPTLTTDAVVRRSADFFLFENASAAQPDGIIDLAVASQPIVLVISDGVTPGISPPREPVFVSPTYWVPVATIEIINQPVRVDLPRVELITVIEKKADVFLYQVDYDDLNEDGEPNLNELPNNDKVLRELKEDNLILFPDKTKPDSAQPTQAEIEKIKEALAEDPETAVGVYSIIKKTADGKNEVLETFPIRDSLEKSKVVRESIQIDPDSAEPTDDNIPAPNPEDGAWMFPSDWKRNSHLELRRDLLDEQETQLSESTRHASLEVLLGSLWVSQSKKQTPAQDRTSETRNPDVSFGSHDRLRRRMQRQLQRWIQQRG